MSAKVNNVYEFEALFSEQAAINIEVRGMIAENEMRAICGNSPAYTSCEFMHFADESKKLAEKFRQLAKEAQKDEQ